MVSDFWRPFGTVLSVPAVRIGCLYILATADCLAKSTTRTNGFEQLL